MMDEPYIYCYGIGPGHQPCLVRKSCQRHVSLQKVPFHKPADTRWHYCQSDGEHFTPVEKTDDEGV